MDVAALCVALRRNKGQGGMWEEIVSQFQTYKDPAEDGHQQKIIIVGCNLCAYFITISCFSPDQCFSSCKNNVFLVVTQALSWTGFGKWCLKSNLKTGLPGGKQT